MSNLQKDEATLIIAIRNSKDPKAAMAIAMKVLLDVCNRSAERKNI